MITNPFKIAWGLIVRHVIGMIMTAAFLLCSGWLFQIPGGQYVFGIISVVVYYAVIYTYTWNIAKKDIRDLPGCEIDENKILTGSIYASVFPLILLIIYFVTPGLQESISVIGEASYKIWFCMYVALYGTNENALLLILPLLVMPVVAYIGYKVGLTGFSVWEKLTPLLLYKKKKDL